jgi:hypothetical protein
VLLMIWTILAVLFVWVAAVVRPDANSAAPLRKRAQQRKLVPDWVGLCTSGDDPH